MTEACSGAPAGALLSATTAIGIDIVDVPRTAIALERAGDWLARRLLTAEETRWTSQCRPARTAICLAVKEATIKAVGKRPAGFAWTDVALLAQVGPMSDRAVWLSRPFGAFERAHRGYGHIRLSGPMLQASRERLGLDSASCGPQGTAVWAHRRHAVVALVLLGA